MQIFVLLAALFSVSFGLDAIQLGQGYSTHCNNPECSSLSLSPISTLQKRQSTAPPDTSTSSDAQQFTVDAANGSIQFTITCKQPTNSRYGDQFCQNVVATFKTVGDELGQIIAFKSNLRISVNFHSFCDGTDETFAPLKANCGGIIGYGKPSAFFFLNSASGLLPDVMFPQALVRQLLSSSPGLTTASGLQEYDAEMKFNTDILFYFGADVGVQNARAIRSDEYDMHYIAAHEVIHALGMVTFFETYLRSAGSQVVQTNPNLQGVDLKNLLTPPIDPGSATTFYKINIYDFYLASTNGARWSSTLQQLNAILDPNADENSRNTALEISRKMFQSATTLKSAQFTYPQGLFKGTFDALADFKTQSSVSVTLNTESTKFATGTSLVHVDSSSYSSSQEFLMRGSAPVGKSLASLVSSYKPMSGPYGKKTIGIIMSMGYTVNSQLGGRLAQELQNAAGPSLFVPNLYTVFSCLFVLVLL